MNIGMNPVSVSYRYIGTWYWFDMGDFGDIGIGFNILLTDTDISVSVLVYRYRSNSNRIQLLSFCIQLDSRSQVDQKIGHFLMKYPFSREIDLTASSFMSVIGNFDHGKPAKEGCFAGINNTPTMFIDDP